MGRKDSRYVGTPGGARVRERERKDSRIGAQGQPHFCAQPTRERSERGASERSERARDHVRPEQPSERSSRIYLDH